MKSKVKIIFADILMVISIILFISGCIIGLVNEDSEKLALYAIIFMFTSSFLFIFGIIIFSKNQKQENENMLEADDLVKNLKTQYSLVKVGENVNINEVCFVNEKLVFSASGEFDCQKDFNGKSGYHFGFLIKGKELIRKPENYDDVIGYKDVLFDISLAYFDDCFLSEPENESGLILDSLTDMEGKKILVDENGGYIAQIFTAESDDISKGEIVFEKWNESEKIISFKLFVPFGVNDIVTGKIKLDNNESFDEFVLTETKNDSNVTG